MLKTGETAENCDVLVVDGKIAAVGCSLEAPSDAEVIDASGKWVTPGFIDVHTHISAYNEPADMHSQHDLNEMTDPVTPQLRIIDALNPNEWSIGQARNAGFTTCYTGPGSTNVVGGTGIAFKLRQGKTIFDLIIPGTENMKFALGENPRNCYGMKGRMPGTRMGVGAVLRETLFNAKVYSDAKLAHEKDPSVPAPAPNFKMESLVPAIRGEMLCRFHCHRADDIVTAVRISEEFGLRFSIEHCTEGYMITDFLKEHNVPVVSGPYWIGPSKFETWNASLQAPAKYEQAGIEFCLIGDGAAGTKNLPVDTGKCIARGLSLEAAFRAITINGAKLLGLDGRLGSLEEGKDADIAIFNGNPFSNLTLCEKTIIDGVVYDNPIE